MMTLQQLLAQPQQVTPKQVERPTPRKGVAFLKQLAVLAAAVILVVAFGFADALPAGPLIAFALLAWAIWFGTIPERGRR